MKCRTEYRVKTEISAFLLVACLFFSFTEGENSDKTVCEKVYLHLDRHFYLSGDDIWFKAYLVNAQTGKLSPKSSRIVYAELISPESKILMRRILYVDSTGCSAGDFKLQNTAVSGKYRIRAYTKWIVNFGDIFVFEKEIEVKNILDETEPADMKKNRKNKKNSQSERIINSEDAEIEFFPESGSMVAGIENTVAFKAFDRSGKSVEVSGGVLSSNGDTVTLFASEYLGTGKFVFTPQEGEYYYAFFMPENIQYPLFAKLPKALNSGFTINITEHDTVFDLNIKTDTKTLEKFRGKKIILVFRQSEKHLFAHETVLDTDSKFLYLPKSLLPAGITRIILYDESEIPYCERLVYVENRNRINVEISFAGDTVSVIKLTGDKGQAVRANLSMSIINNTVPDENFDIETYFWLESEIKGKIERPSAYFDTANANRFKNMDLLLLTQGWRDFVWRRLENDTADFPGYYMEHGLKISGHVKKLSKKTSVNANVIMYFPHLGIDNGVKLTQTDSVGNYNFGEINFWGEQYMFINSKSEKNKDIGEISVNPLCMQAEHFPVKIQENYEPDSIYAPPVKNYRDNDYKLTDTVILDAVKITGKNSKGWLVLDREITSKDEKWKSLELYLYGKVPDLLLGHDRVRYNFYDMYGNKMNNSIPPSKISLKEVEKIMMYKIKNQLIRQTFEIEDENGMLREEVRDITRTIYEADVYSLVNKFTRQNYPKKALTVNESGMAIITDIDHPKYNSFMPVLNGYYEARTFYTPKFGENSEIENYFGTFFWKPDICTDINGESVVNYNPQKQPSGKIRIEGITDSGVPFAVNY